MQSYDLRDAAFLADPGPVLARMRDAGPLVRTRLPLFGDLMLTTTDEAARALLKDPRFSRDPAAAGGKPIQRYFWWMPGFMRPLLETMLAKDGAAHKRLRGLVDKAFSRHSIEDMRPAIARMADGLLEALPVGAPADIVGSYARPLPLMAICELLGVPDADRVKVSRWISHVSGPTGFASFLAALPGLYRTMGYFRGRFAEVRADPGAAPPGLIRQLAAVEADGDRLSENELLSMVFTLFVAGHVTTVHLISNGILGFLDRRENPGDLVADPGRLGLAVEEFMRFFTPVLMSKPHFATEDLEFMGVPVARGARISALLIGANHDPARFEAPGEMQVARRPNAHLGFGHGPHVCLGMQLARIEAQVALERLFTRFPGVRFAGAREAVAFSRQTGVRGVDRLELVLSPAR